MERREPRSTPLEEDEGLFTKGIVEISVEVTPLFRRTNRDDILVKGFCGSGKIDVIFPGRRSKNTRPLLSRLARLEKRARRAARDAGRDYPDPLDIRMRIVIEGSWRQEFFDDGSGWQRHRYQLLAARWIIPTDEGQPALFGSRPLSKLT